MRRMFLGGLSAIGVATASMLIGVAPVHANSPCEIYNPLFDEYEYFADGTVMDVEGEGTIVCHEGQWAGPAVDSPVPGGPVVA